MKVLSQIPVNKRASPAVIQLLKGDLTAIPAEHAADILVVSAYPGNYSTYDKKTLIAALGGKGISIAALAADKEADLVNPLSCWLSKRLTETQQEQFNIKRILCFEPPLHSVDPQVAVGNIFRCINSFAFSEQNNVIAMPVLASGNQKVPIVQMLPVMLDTALFWLGNGLPLKAIKLVLYTDEQVEIALPIFNLIKDTRKSPADMPLSRGGPSGSKGPARGPQRRPSKQ